MLYNKYVCPNPVTITTDGDEVTFSLVDSRPTSVAVKRAVIQKKACEYVSANNYSHLVTLNCYGFLPLVFSGGSNSATLLIPGISESIPPTILVQPADSEDLTVGDTLTLYVIATGPSLSYQWVKGASNIPGATSATLEITNAQESDSGTYYVVVSNSDGSVNSEESLVTITAAPVAPTITVQPSASESLEVGDTLTLTVTATGDSPLSYQWRVGGVNIPGKTSPTLQIVNVQESDAGTYTVVVTNPAGSATSNNSVVSVSVPTPVAPTITVQPQASVSLTVGDTLNLSVTATGTAPLSYQWKVGGVDITGETASTLEILNMQEADAGTYTVAVTNSAGTATSNNSVVSVSVPVPNSVYQRPDGSDIFQPDGTSQYVRP